MDVEQRIAQLDQRLDDLDRVVLTTRNDVVSLRQQQTALTLDLSASIRATRQEHLEHQRRLDAVERRLDAVERRLDAVERRLDAIEQRLNAGDRRLDAMERRLERWIAGAAAATGLIVIIWNVLSPFLSSLFP